MVRTKIALSTAVVTVALATVNSAFDAASVSANTGRTAPIVPVCVLHRAPVAVHPDPGRCGEIASTRDGAHAGASSSRHGGARQENVDQACGSAVAKLAAMVRASDPSPTFASTPVHGGEVGL